MNQDLGSKTQWQQQGDFYRILLVENDLQFQLFLQTFLETIGYQVQTCTAALDAIEHNQQTRFDAILINILLPGMDGIQLIEKLKQAQNCPPLIAMAGVEQQQEGFLSLALMQGADAVLFKPINIEQLKQRLKMLINQHNYQQQQGDQDQA